jgi:hypothetical protein
MTWRRPSRVKVGIGVRVDGVDDLTVFRVELAQSQGRPRGSGSGQTVGQFLIHYRYPQGASSRILPGRFLARPPPLEIFITAHDFLRVLSITGLNITPGVGLADFRNLHGPDIAKETGSKIARHVMGDWRERLVVVPASDGKT